SRTGFISTVGAIPAAAACAAWARLISPPATVTKALLDIFCALKGATRTPRRAKIRQSAAQSRLLPTEDPVPCSISARPVMRRATDRAGPRRGTDAGQPDQNQLLALRARGSTWPSPRPPAQPPRSRVARRGERRPPPAPQNPTPGRSGPLSP